MGQPALERTYTSAVDSYNAGIWDACAMSCGKTLEGIVQTQFPDAEGTLFEKLQQVFARQELLEPLKHLTDTVRRGRNINAHFNLDIHPDHKTAMLMLDLIDFIVDYIFGLKSRSERLAQRLDGLGNDGT